MTLYRTILTAAQRPRIFLAVTTAMLPLNALGNHLLMHGFGPVPAFWPTGAGLSSLTTGAAAAVTAAGLLLILALMEFIGTVLAPVPGHWSIMFGSGALPAEGRAVRHRKTARGRGRLTGLSRPA